MGKSYITVLLVVILVLTACEGTDQETLGTVAPTETSATSQENPILKLNRHGFLGNPLSAAEVKTLVEEFDAAVAALVAADNAHDLELVRQVFTGDVEVADGDDGYTGIDNLIDNYKNIWALSSTSAVQHAATYVGRRDDAAVAGVAQLDGFNLLGYTEENPFVEYRLMETLDGQIASWTSFYDPETRPNFTAIESVDEAASAVLNRYMDAWSSGDASEVCALYAPDTLRVDTCLHSEGRGRDAIESTAAGMFDLYPGIGWKLLQPIGGRSRYAVETGGVFAIQFPGTDKGLCEIGALVLLSAGDEGIDHEEIYYDAASLIDCGWVS